MRFRQNQRDKLKERFKDYIFYKLCKTTRNAFLLHYANIMVSSEDLFADAAQILDELLTERDINAERCSELWSEKLSIYRENDTTLVDVAVSQAEVAMLFYTVMFGLESVNHSHYCRTLQKTLYSHLSLMWNKQNERSEDVENTLFGKITPLGEEMHAWMEGYFTSVESLTEEIKKILNPGSANVAQTGLPLPITLNTKRAQTYFQKAIDSGLMKLENDKFSWIQIGNKGKNSQLAYFCGLVYEYKHSTSGNIGTIFPDKDLESLFGIKRIYNILVQAHDAKRKQAWRRKIDELFE